MLATKLSPRQPYRYVIAISHAHDLNESLDIINSINNERLDISDLLFFQSPHSAQHHCQQQIMAKAGQYLDHDLKRSKYATIYDKQPEAIPATFDDVYRPEHPDADWSGHVQKIPQKRHALKHRSQQIHIQHEDGGLVGSSSSAEHQKLQVGKGQKTDREVFMGGIGCGDDQWKTSYHRFQGQEKTTRDQLTVMKRAPPRKPLPDPVYGHSHHQQSYSDLIGSVQVNPYDRTSNVHEQTTFYRPRSKYSNRSFLGSLGASLAGGIPDENKFVKNGVW
jgi:hypothetical protein